MTKLRLCIEKLLNNTEQRITGPKLADSLAQMSKMSLKTCEWFVLESILNEDLKLDFHFTPYKIITYVVFGHKWQTKVNETRKKFKAAVENEEIVIE